VDGNVLHRREGRRRGLEEVVAVELQRLAGRLRDEVLEVVAVDGLRLRERAVSCVRGAGVAGAARGAVWLVMVGVWTGGTTIARARCPLPGGEDEQRATPAISAAMRPRQRPEIPTPSSREKASYFCYDEPRADYSCAKRRMVL